MYLLDGLLDDLLGLGSLRETESSVGSDSLGLSEESRGDSSLEGGTEVGVDLREDSD